MSNEFFDEILKDKKTGHADSSAEEPVVAENLVQFKAVATKATADEMAGKKKEDPLNHFNIRDDETVPDNALLNIATKMEGFSVKKAALVIGAIVLVIIIGIAMMVVSKKSKQPKVESFAATAPTQQRAFDVIATENRQGVIQMPSQEENEARLRYEAEISRLNNELRMVMSERADLRAQIDPVVAENAALKQELSDLKIRQSATIQSAPKVAAVQKQPQSVVTTAKPAEEKRVEQSVQKKPRTADDLI